MKILSDKVFWIVLVLLAVYLFYSKGSIEENFKSVSPKVAYEILQNDNNITLLDVRTIKEFNQDGKIAGAKLIPLAELSQNLQMLDKSKKVLVYCHSGKRSVAASHFLSRNGYTVINIRGGIVNWHSNKLPVE